MPRALPPLRHAAKSAVGRVPRVATQHKYRSGFSVRKIRSIRGGKSGEATRARQCSTPLAFSGVSPALTAVHGDFATVRRMQLCWARPSGPDPFGPGSALGRGHLCYEPIVSRLVGHGEKQIHPTALPRRHGSHCGPRRQLCGSCKEVLPHGLGAAPRLFRVACAWRVARVILVFFHSSIRALICWTRRRGSPESGRVGRGVKRNAQSRELRVTGLLRVGGWVA